MDIVALISNACLAVAKVFGYRQQRDAEKNAPDVRAAAIAGQEQRQVDKTNQAIAKQDVAEIRKELAE